MGFVFKWQVLTANPALLFIAHSHTIHPISHAMKIKYTFVDTVVLKRGD